MLVLVSYDVSTESEGGKKRLRQVDKVCQGFGLRVQNSVFECLIDYGQAKQLQIKLESIIDEDKDSLRFYFLGDNWQRKVVHIGAKAITPMDDLLIV